MDFDDSSDSIVEHSSPHSRSSSGESSVSTIHANAVLDADRQCLSFDDANAVLDAAPPPTPPESPEEEPCHHQLIGDDTRRPHARHGRRPDAQTPRIGDAHAETDAEGLVDVTASTRLAASLSAEAPDVLTKSVALFAPAASRDRRERERMPETLSVTLERIASHTITIQETLEEADLTHGAANPVCLGVESVRVEPNGVLVAVLDAEQCAVSLSDVMAFALQPFAPSALAAMMKSIVLKIAAIHAAGLVHGCLHGGNVLCCANDGHVVLTGVGRAVTNAVFPTDPSFISPRMAAAMRPMVMDLFGKRNEESSEAFYAWAADTAFHKAVLEIYGVEPGELQAVPSDDLYAIGILTLFCALGVPPFHAVPLKDVIEALTAEENGKNLVELLLGSVLSTQYAARRFELAGYTPEFLDALRDFVSICLAAHNSADVCVETLFDHPFFLYIPLSSTGNEPNDDQVEEDEENEEEEEEEEANEERTTINGIIHHVTYPIYCVVQNLRENCSTPLMMPRFYRNSIFAARWDALQSSVLDSYNNKADSCDAVAVLWPYIDNASPLWRAFSPNMGTSPVESDQVKKAYSWQSRLYHNGTKSSHSFSPSSPSPSSPLSMEAIATQKGVLFGCQGKVIIYHNKNGARFVLDKDNFTSHVPADTLILRDLEECQLEIFSSFRFIVISNVRRCKLLFGACYGFYCEKATESTIQVAATHGFLGESANLKISFNGRTLKSFGETANLQNVTISPLHDVYAGMSANFATVTLAQMHVRTLRDMGRVMQRFVRETDVQTEGSSIDLIQLHRRMCGGFDFPFSHTLVASGLRFLHQDDSTSDVFLYFDITMKNVFIQRIHGGSGGEEPPPAPTASRLSSNVTRHSLWTSQTAHFMNGNAGNASQTVRSRYPVIFIFDTLGDCVIEDCSQCTIFIAASTSSITLRRCSQMRLFCMSREAILENCEQLDVYMFVTEFVYVSQCRHIELNPLALSVPRLDELLKAVVDACEDAQQAQVLQDALVKKDVVQLNALLRANHDPGCVDVLECEEVHINEHSAVLFVVDFTPSRDPSSRFFYDAYRGTRSLSDWVRVPIMERIWGAAVEQRRSALGTPRGVLTPRSTASVTTEAPVALPPVRFHDLLGFVIERGTGTLTPRLSGAQAGPEGAPLVDVVLERLSSGSVRIVEAVGTLFIRRCMGPLDIIVAAAHHVVLLECEHVTLRTACVSFLAKDSHSCHVALHVNTPPHYVECTMMQTSTLNVTADDLEWCLERSGVSQETNCFGDPWVQSSESDSAPPSPAEQGLGAETGKSISTALKTLHAAVFVVPPLPALCFGVKDVAFLGFLEDRVKAEEHDSSLKRYSLSDRILQALDCLAHHPMGVLIDDVKAPDIPNEREASVSSKTSSIHISPQQDPLCPPLHPQAAPPSYPTEAPTPAEQEEEDVSTLCAPHCVTEVKCVGGEEDPTVVAEHSSTASGGSGRAMDLLTYRSVPGGEEAVLVEDTRRGRVALWGRFALHRADEASVRQCVAQCEAVREAAEATRGGNDALGEWKKRVETALQWLDKLHR